MFLALGQTVTSILHDIVRRSPELADSTRDRYLRDLNAWIAFAGEDQTNWTRYKAQAFYDFMITKGLKPQSATRVMASISYASSWWAKLENNDRLHFVVIQMGKAKNKIPKHALTEDQTLALLATCMSDLSPINLRDFALMIVGLETGMRRMSLIGMRLEEIYDQPYPYVRVPAKGKDQELLAVPLSSTAATALQPWIQWLALRNITKGPIFRGMTRRLDRHGHWVYTANKKAISPAAIQNTLVKRSTAAKINHVHPHMFRHTFVTWRINAGLAPHEIASITGHRLSGLGAMAGYIDMTAIAQKARESTPTFISQIVSAFVNFARRTSS